MFRPDAGWVPLVTALATVAGRTYLGRYRMDQQNRSLQQGTRDALWMNHDFYAAHLLNCHESPWSDCPISTVIQSVGWDTAAFLVASAFDCRDLLDG